MVLKLFFFLAFVVKFVTKRFIHEYLHNQNSRYVHEMEFKDGNRHHFEILDLSKRVGAEQQLSSSDDDNAQDEFEDQLRWGDVFFLMFSILGFWIACTISKKSILNMKQVEIEQNSSFLLLYSHFLASKSRVLY